LLILRTICGLILLSLITSCASLVSGVTSQLAGDLADTLLNSEDVDTVKEGVPAYLLLIDSFLRSSPDNVDLLLAAADLNGSYSFFVPPERAKLLTKKSRNYAGHAACIANDRLCNLDTIDYQEFEQRIATIGPRDIETAYALGVAWTGWLQAHSDDWNAIGQLGRVKLLMARLVELDETWQSGGPHLYMGGLETLLPASMGGKPEKGKQHFERSLQLSEGKYLMTKVIYAEQYARLVFDKVLHDRLLTEVVEADPVAPGMTLTNRLAQARAAELLADSDEYF
jgi:hypothetical protein